MTIDSGRVTGSREPDPSSTGSGPPGFDPARSGVRCPDGDRPAREPGGCECQRCGCIFIGEDGHQFCALCIVAVAREIADSQGQVIIREPEPEAIAMEARQGGDGVTRLHPKDDSAGRQASPGTGEGTDHG